MPPPGGPAPAGPVQTFPGGPTPPIKRAELFDLTHLHLGVPPAAGIGQPLPRAAQPLTAAMCGSAVSGGTVSGSSVWGDPAHGGGEEGRTRRRPRAGPSERRLAHPRACLAAASAGSRSRLPCRHRSCLVISSLVPPAVSRSSFLKSLSSCLLSGPLGLVFAFWVCPGPTPRYPCRWESGVWDAAQPEGQTHQHRKVLDPGDQTTPRSSPAPSPGRPSSRGSSAPEQGDRQRRQRGHRPPPNGKPAPAARPVAHLVSPLASWLGITPLTCWSPGGP